MKEHSGRCPKDPESRYYEGSSKPLTAAEYWNENSRCFPEGDFMQEDQQVMKWEEFKAYSAAKDAEIAKISEDRDKGWKWSERLAKLLDDEKGKVKEKDAEIEQLREELMDSKKELKATNITYNSVFNDRNKIKLDLEAVKKERDEARQMAEQLATANATFYLTDNKLKHQLDEAVEILKECNVKVNIGNRPDLIRWAEKRDAFLSRLSSGKPKPVNICPHCTSTDVTPYGTTQEFYCKSCGRQFGNELPAPPESTDKM
jgi:hypothetical protein